MSHTIPPSTPTFCRQISLRYPLPVWCLIRDEAARRGIPITELCQEWIAPHLAQLNPNSHSCDHEAIDP